MPLVEPCRLLEDEAQGDLKVIGQIFPVLDLCVVGDDAPELFVFLLIPVYLWRIDEVTSRKGKADDEVVVNSAGWWCGRIGLFLGWSCIWTR